MSEGVRGGVHGFMMCSIISVHLPGCHLWLMQVLTESG